MGSKMLFERVMVNDKLAQVSALRISSARSLDLLNITWRAP
jgi:hypothetical protein